MTPAPYRPTRDQAAEMFGDISLDRGIWPLASAWCRIVGIPEEIAEHWVNAGTNQPTSRVYVHKWMAAPLLAALDAVRDRGLLPELKTFDGCFNVRAVRGWPGRFSWHSYALALDLNAAENRLGLLPRLSAPFVECFTEQGFIWGGDFQRPDGQHFQFAVG